MQITPSQYGSYNLIPVIGMLLGSIISSYLGKSYSSHNILKFGLFIVSIGAILALVLLNYLPKQALSLFMPTTIVYIGLPLVFANASSLTLTNAKDKSNASAMLSFINLSTAVVVTLLLTLISIHSALTIAILFVVFSIFAIIWFTLLNKALKLN
jgi:MFS family permease